MKIPAAPASATYEVKHSKFIAHLVPYRLFEQTLAQLKAEHPKARHHVTAFRFLNEHMQVVEGSSDDGEPKGTSGKPSLAVLAGHDLIDVAVITVRYFGGTKLGTGGLVRAYTQAVSDVVAAVELCEYIRKETLSFRCGYAEVSQVEYLLKQCGVETRDKRFETEAVQWEVEAGRANLDDFLLRSDYLVTQT